MWRSIIRVAAATITWSVVHSLLASRKTKQRVVRQWGHRRYNQLYRPFYTAQSFVTLGLLCLYTRRLPDRELYQVRSAPALLMRFGQTAALAYFLWTVYYTGIGRVSGLSNLLAYLKGTEYLPDTEAQGPYPRNDGTLATGGPFRFSRHPLNFAAVPLLWLFPRMGVKLATFNSLATLYFILGSYHEELRLRAAYREAYEDYQNSGVPFFLPDLSSRLLPPPS